METRTKSQLLRTEIWSLLVAKVSYKEIMQRLHLSHGAFFRHLAAIKVQNRKWIEELAKDEFVFEYRLSLESMKELQRRLMAVAEKSTNDRHRIEAYRLCKEIELDIFRLLGEGPTVLALKRRAAVKAERLKGAPSAS